MYSTLLSGGIHRSLAADRSGRRIREIRRETEEGKGSENRGKSKNRCAAFPILFALHTHRRGSAFRLSNAVKKIFLK